LHVILKSEGAMKLSDRHNDEGYNYYAKMKLKYWISIEVKKKPMQNMLRKRFNTLKILL
jgi:hypothetical protein